MRCTVTEYVVMKTVRVFDFVHMLFDVGLICNSNVPYMAFSRVGIALVDHSFKKKLMDGSPCTRLNAEQQ